jgi:hypothetical protein
MKTIPTCIARSDDGEGTVSIYRTAEGRIALQRTEGADLEFYDTVEDVVGQVPANVAEQLRASRAFGLPYLTDAG